MGAAVQNINVALTVATFAKALEGSFSQLLDKAASGEGVDRTLAQEAAAQLAEAMGGTGSGVFKNVDTLVDIASEIANARLALIKELRPLYDTAVQKLKYQEENLNPKNPQVQAQRELVAELKEELEVIGEKFE